MVALSSDDGELHTPFNIRRNHLIHNRLVEFGEY